MPRAPAVHRRPLEPTPAGHAYLVHVREALGQLRQGAVAVSLADLTRLRRLRLGVTDDLDGEITPRLATVLADALPRCELSLLTVPMIGRQIGTDLAWRKIVLPGRISVDSNPVLFGLIAGTVREGLRTRVVDPMLATCPRAQGGAVRRGAARVRPT